MKKISNFIFIMFILLIIIPFCILRYSDISSPKPNDIKLNQINDINVYFHEQDVVIPMNIDEYLKGVVSAEMPANFEVEALKAQAIAARTYTLLHVIQKPELKLEHKGGDICTDFRHCQAYKTKDQLKEGWGLVNYFRYYEKISKCVNDTTDRIIVYNNEIINPLYHSTSSGKTENSEDVFIESVPYLRSVISQGEAASPRYSSKTVISLNDFKSKLKEFDSNIIIKGNTCDIKVIERTESGSVKSIQIANRILSGKDVRRIFSLNSTNFNITIEKNNVVFSTLGYGHGVGMSQFGANYLAKQGKNYEEILKYYYKDVDVVKIADIQ